MTAAGAISDLVSDRAYNRCVYARSRLCLFQRALFERFSQRLLDSDVIATTCRLDVGDKIGGQTKADLLLRRGDWRTPDRPYAFHGFRQLWKHLGDWAQVHIFEVFISQFADLALFVGQRSEWSSHRRSNWAAQQRPH
jgi:hypothetical protein